MPPVLVHGRKRPETSLRHKDIEKVMNYFPGLANWPVGENKKMTVYVFMGFGDSCMCMLEPRKHLN